MTARTARALPPLNREYHYNLELFNALSGLDLNRISFFTAYTAGDARTTYAVLRCELVDWAEAEGFEVTAVATILDPIYSRWDWRTMSISPVDVPGRRPGSYYDDVIKPCERALLAVEAANNSDKLDVAAEVQLGSRVGQTLTYGDILELEMQLMKTHTEGSGRSASKLRLAEYCLTHEDPSNIQLLFLDDNAEYIKQVQTATASKVADLRCVLVKSSFVCSELRSRILHGFRPTDTDQ